MIRGGIPTDPATYLAMRGPTPEPHGAATPLSLGPCAHCGLAHPNGIPEHLIRAGHPYMTGRDNPREVADIGGRVVEWPAT